MKNAINGKLRSVLYVPGINEKAMGKVSTLAVDAVIFDLEDSVLPEKKKEAREKVAAFFQANRDALKDKRLVIRVNGKDTPYWDDDLAMAQKAMPDAVLLPKVTNPDIISDARSKLSAATQEPPKIWCMVENPMGILRLERIVEQGVALDVECLVLGTNDLVKDSDIEPGEGRCNLIPWFSLIMLVAKSFDVSVIDGVLNDIRNDEALQSESEAARALGMSGKTIIHPAQVETVNRCFSPTTEQLAWWRRIVHAYAQPENTGKGVISLDGTMVERLHLEIAQRRLRDFDQMP